MDFFNNTEKKLDELEKKINPPERNLMLTDLIKYFIKIILIICLGWFITCVSFFIYISVKDYQHNKVIETMNQQFNEFLNKFEFVDNNYTQDGYGNNIIGDNNTAYGAEGKD